MATQDWPVFQRIFYRLFIGMMGRYVEMFTDEQTVEGLENIPSCGPYLIVSNHLNFTDPQYICRSIRQPINFMVKEELFSYPIIGFGLRLLGTFPVDRHGNDIGALRHALILLERGNPVMIFPEGTRSKTRALARPFPGAGFLALKARVPVLPVGVFGSEDLSITRIPSGPARRIGLRIGQLFNLQVPATLGTRASAEWAAWEMLRHIALLLPKSYHGVLAGSNDTSNTPII
jgi:1-acyl-sn-glycerol-3-phosphate acyltransferase